MLDRMRIALILALAASSLMGQTHRVLVSTDLGGDPDDIQSLYRLLHYSDILKIEGIVSSPGPGAKNSARLVSEWIRKIDIERMRKRHPELIGEESALALVKQGQQTPGTPSSARKTEGSEWIRARAKAGDAPLWVLVWGSITDVAQALHDEPEIAGRIRIYYIGSSNTVADEASRDWVYRFMAERAPKLWWIENGVMPRRSRDTFRGVYQGGNQEGEWSNTEFVRVNIRGKGAPGDAFPLATSPPGTLKEGDSPSMLYLLSPVLAKVGDVDDPSRESWGGQFARPEPERFPNYWADLKATAATCQNTIAKWREAFLSDWKKRWGWYE
jgi:hypothetical protein